ncbi:MAG: JAB domain-containing protein, partial [Bacteroidota bacterium]
SDYDAAGEMMNGLAKDQLRIHYGRRQPSQADLEITRKLVAGAKLFDIAFLDHVIITHEGYYSFADEGML